MSGRCRACNAKLNEFEMTRKEAETGRYVDLCNRCFKVADYEEIPVLGRTDLGDMEDDDYPPNEDDFVALDNYPFIHRNPEDDDS